MATTNEILARINSLQLKLENLEKKSELFKKPNRLTIELIILIILIQSYYPIKSITLSLNIIDSYLKLISTSWPAVTLILFVFLFMRHRDAIDGFIKRIKSVGPKGVDSYTPSGPPDAKTGRIEDRDREEFYKNESSQSEYSSTALVDFKIASELPNTVKFDLLKDWKVWFWIINREAKRYRAYVKIKFLADGYEEDVSEGYYGGTKAWNLNAFSGIQAPGLDIPGKMKEKANKKEKIKIMINCTVKDENDEFVEKKLPSVYTYEYENKYWYLEP